ncbi:MAG: hypothetical protein CMJ78_03155 [Planctomycetaceae bacterium]|nr:hypothetical protein [Planctomycetaceae bacterium]
MCVIGVVPKTAAQQHVGLGPIGPDTSTNTARHISVVLKNVSTIDKAKHLVAMIRPEIDDGLQKLKRCERMRIGDAFSRNMADPALQPKPKRTVVRKVRRGRGL